MKPRLHSLLFCCALGAACAPAVLLAAPPGKVLEKNDTRIGTGATAAPGSTVTIHYTGWLFSPRSSFQHGSKFDTSRDGKPATFKLGAGAVIKGWDEGIAGMRVGGQRTLIVPSAMGFGKAGRGPVPPGSNLIFDIELVETQN